MNIFAIDFQEAYCLLIPRISLGKMLLKNYFSLQSSKMSFFFPIKGELHRIVFEQFKNRGANREFYIFS